MSDIIQLINNILNDKNTKIYINKYNVYVIKNQQYEILFKYKKEKNCENYYMWCYKNLNRFAICFCIKENDKIIGKKELINIYNLIKKKYGDINARS